MNARLLPGTSYDGDKKTLAFSMSYSFLIPWPSLCGDALSGSRPQSSRQILLSRSQFNRLPNLVRYLLSIGE